MTILETNEDEFRCNLFVARAEMGAAFGVGVPGALAMVKLNGTVAMPAASTAETRRGLEARQVAFARSWAGALSTNSRDAFRPTPDQHANRMSALSVIAAIAVSGGLMFTMAEVRSDLESQGWSRQVGTLSALQIAVVVDGALTAVRGARNNQTRLVPYETAKAPRNSMSAVYGLGAQPLHSDGAHLRVPPDVVVLHSPTVTPTSTVVWTPPRRGRAQLDSSSRHGIFTVRGNGESFLAVANDRGKLRFDPVVMSPGDAYARETAAYFERARATAEVHEWDEPNLLLFIDNRKALHAREEVLDPETRSISRVAYQWGERA